MLSREKEFLQARAKMLPILLKKFGYYVKVSKVKKGKIEYAKDLAHQTIAVAYEDCMNPFYDHLKSVDLIMMKAKNVWVADWKKRQRTIAEVSIDPVEFEWKNGEIPEQELNLPINYERLMEMTTSRQVEILNQRRDGYKVNEIAKKDGVKPGVITMQIQRLKLKFLSKK
jgi:hypothetical protein